MLRLTPQRKSAAPPGLVFGRVSNTLGLLTPFGRRDAPSPASGRLAGDPRPRPHIAAAGGFTPQAMNMSPLRGSYPGYSIHSTTHVRRGGTCIEHSVDGRLLFLLILDAT
jgi:hypothetical protein